MRTYLILKEKAGRWNADQEIQTILADINKPSTQGPATAAFSQDHVQKLLAYDFDRATLAAKSLPYERLDQLTVEVLLGAR